MPGELPGGCGPGSLVSSGALTRDSDRTITRSSAWERRGRTTGSVARPWSPVTAAASSHRTSLARWPTSWKRSRSKLSAPSRPRRGCACHLAEPPLSLPACSRGCSLRSHRSCTSRCGPPSSPPASSPTAWWGWPWVRSLPDGQRAAPSHQHRPRCVGGGRAGGAWPELECWVWRSHSSGASRSGHCPHLPFGPQRAGGSSVSRPLPDRKSTRLNSSH